MPIFRISFGIKGYKILDLESKRVFISKNVVIHEDQFPYKNDSTSENTNTKLSQPILTNIDTEYHIPFSPTNTTNEVLTDRTEIDVKTLPHFMSRTTILQGHPSHQNFKN